MSSYYSGSKNVPHGAGGRGGAAVPGSRFVPGLRVPPKKRPKKPPKASPRKPGETIEEWAARMVDELISARVASVEAERQAYLDELHNESNLRAQQGAALAQALQAMNMPGTIQGIFGNAGEAIGSLAKGFQGQVGQIANAQAAEQAQMLSGTGQEGAVRNQGENMGNVLYGTGGFLPANSLIESGAGFAAQAALEPAFAQRQAAEEAAAILQEGMKGLSGFSTDIAKIKAERPTLMEEYKNQRLELQNDEYERQQDALDAKRDWYLKLAALEISRGNAKRANEYLRLAQQDQVIQNNDAFGLDPAGNPQPGMHYETNPRTGKQQLVKDGWRLNKNGVPVKVNATNEKNLRDPKWRQEQVTNVNEAAKKIVADIEEMGREDNGRLLYPPRNIMVRRLWRLYKYLGTTPSAKKALRKLINELISAAYKNNRVGGSSGSSSSDSGSSSPSGSSGGGGVGGLLEP